MTELAGMPDLEHARLDGASLAGQIAHHPQIAVLDREEEVARTEVRLAEANRKSDWSVEVAFQQRGSTYSNMLSVGLSVPLQWDRARRQDRELAARLAMADQAKGELVPLAAERTAAVLAAYGAANPRWPRCWPRAAMNST